MSDPLFWLALSLLLVAVSLTAVLVALLPAVRELSRAARSAEKLFDTLNRDLPPTLDAIRRTGLELTDLTDNVSEGVQSAGRMVKQVDQSLLGVQQQAKRAQRVTRSLAVGFRAAWQTLLQPAPPARPTRSHRAVQPESHPDTSPDRDNTQDDWADSDRPHRPDKSDKYADKYDDKYANEYADHRPDAEVDSARDPDGYLPRVYSSEQYDEPYLWNDASEPEPAQSSSAEPLLSGRSPTSARSLDGEARDAWEQDLWEEDAPPLENQPQNPPLS